MLGVPTVTIAKTQLTSNSASVTLNINTDALQFTARHLVIRINARHNSQDDGVYLRFNGDSGNNYNNQSIQGTDSAEAFTHASNQSAMWLCKIDDEANEYDGGEWVCADAFTTNSDKNVLGVGGVDNGYGLWISAGRWANTAAITSVTILNTAGTGFASGSYFELAVADEYYNVYENVLTGASTFDSESIVAIDGDLVLIGNLRNSIAANPEELSLSFNNDNTEGNYLRQRLNGHQAEVAAYSNAVDLVGHCAGDGLSDANVFSSLVAQIPQFADTTTSRDRQALALAGGHFEADSAEIALTHMRFNNTGAINRLTLHGRNTANFLAKSMLSVYAVPKKLIGRTELTGTANSISITSIPDTYDHLEVSLLARSDRSATGDNILMSLTADGGSVDTTDGNYNVQTFRGNGSTDAASSSTSEGRSIGLGVGGNETADVFGLHTTFIPNYRLTDRHKSYVTLTGYGDSNPGAEANINRWQNTAEIDAIQVEPKVGTNFVAGTILEVRGIDATVVEASSDVEDRNDIAKADIAAINGVTVDNMANINSVEIGVAPDSDDHTLLESVTWTTSDTAKSSISFTALDSGYDVYEFHFANLHPATNDEGLSFQVNALGESGYNETATTSFFRSKHDEAGGGSHQSVDYVTAYDVAQGTGYIRICNDVGNDNDQSVSGILTLYKPASSAYVKHFTSRMVETHASDIVMDNFVAGYINITNSINQIDFKFTSGNADAGEVRIYGVGRA